MEIRLNVIYAMNISAQSAMTREIFPHDDFYLQYLHQIINKY